MRMLNMRTRYISCAVKGYLMSKMVQSACVRVLVTCVQVLWVCGASAQDGEIQVMQPSSKSVLQPANTHAPRDWAQFRGPGGMAVGPSDTVIPVQWSEENFRWKTKLPGAGSSSPIVLGERVYVTCYRGYGVSNEPQGSLEQLRLDLVCLDRSSGEILWVKSSRPVFPEQEAIRDGHGYSSSTPVADQDSVYVFFGKTGVFAFGHGGKPRWHTRVGSRTHGWGTAASPVIFQDLVIVNASVESDALVALDRKSGKEIWRTKGIREAWNTPLLMKNTAGKTELIVPIFGKVLSLDPATGQQNWVCNTGIQWYMVPSAVAHDGVVYCIGGRSGDSLAIRSGGTGDVTATHRIWQAKKGSNVSSPIVHEGYLYWIHDQRGIAYCAKLATGELVYEERLPRVGQVYASPILVDGKIYCVSREGSVVVLAAKPKFEVLGTNQLEHRGRFDASPAVTEGQLLIRSNRYIYCIGAPH